MSDESERADREARQAEKIAEALVLIGGIRIEGGGVAVVFKGRAIGDTALLVTGRREGERREETHLVYACRAIAHDELNGRIMRCTVALAKRLLGDDVPLTFFCNGG